jgi:hypothetical protein
MIKQWCMKGVSMLETYEKALFPFLLLIEFIILVKIYVNLKQNQRHKNIVEYLEIITV